jgi:photosystem II stability/assembly factor-like uncharacterized protein
VFRSSDGGHTWTAAPVQPTNEFVNCLVARGTTLLAGTYGGVFRSTDDGLTWIAATQPSTTRDVTALAASSTILVAGTTGGAILGSTDDGRTWTVLIEREAEVGTPWSLMVDGATLLAGSVWTGIWWYPL